ncbi:hypothetical protein [Polaribacter sp. R77954]|uniref:hypothetical protein n=1 Tax=Polaribacter sp. R77954 TaxID=3093870 RepID=UPI0037CB7A78
MRTKRSAYISLSLACCYIIGFVCLFTFFSPLIDGKLDKKEQIAYYMSNKVSLQFWYLTIYVLFGVLLIPLVSMVKNLFKKNSLSDFASIVGYIWAAFVMASGFIFTVGIEKISQMKVDIESIHVIFTTIQIIQDALSGGVELLGGIWVFCIGVIALKSKYWNKYFNLFSLLLGSIVFITVLPYFYGFVGVFGMLQIIWFIWLGFMLCREQEYVSTYILW